ncbi:hypothetical protein A3194_12290 [Candidatus Thiodiazotropha endoloripes]|uniref:S1 family peptidase n=1 Tax=Candidatus Thiodiazotropha endoloripes TaxID=1818881 RepID=UPI00083DEFA7|nr:serine protease [Candidatus Thiodiazotropha endoloripes]ODB85609.1 hypothetical protein A3194_12290 [Candidatus Thiodiazotropha endoloripes]
MKKNANFLLFYVSIAFCTLISLQVNAIEEELDKKTLKDIESKVAVVIATALGSENSDKTGEPASAKATGFFVSGNGLLVTSYHTLSKLKKELGEYDEETLEFSVYQGSALSQIKWAAFQENFDPKLDLLSLNVQVGGGGVNYFKYDPQIESVVKLSTEVYTYGYPEGYTYLNDKGVIKSFEGPAGNEHLWVTSMEFKNGQSGSPVFLSDGRLLGLVKGAENSFQKNNFFVPVTSIDNLLGGRLERVVGSENNSPEEEIGRIKVVAKVEAVEPRERTMKRSFYERNSHCSGSRDIVWHVEASDGWKIDPRSIKTTITSQSSQSHFRGITNVNSDGFYLTGATRNNGDCIRVFGKVAAKDGRGWLGVDVSYKEMQDEIISKDVEVYVKSVYSGETIKRELPESTSSLTTYFETKEGKIVTNEGEGKFDYYSVSLDKRNGSNLSVISIK